MMTNEPTIFFFLVVGLVLLAGCQKEVILLKSNVTLINTTIITNGSGNGTGVDSWWPIDDYWLINESGVLSWNDSLANQSYLVVANLTYINNINESLDGVQGDVLLLQSYKTNQTSMDCPSDYYAFGYLANGSPECRHDSDGISVETDPVFSGNLSGLLANDSANYFLAFVANSSLWIAKLNVSDQRYNESAAISILNVSLQSAIRVSLVNLTTTTYNGSLINGTKKGYTAGDAICNQTFTGSRFCNEFEITYWVQQNTFTFTGDAWVIAGSPKYIPATVPVNDCNGFTYDGVTTYLGNYWHFNITTGGDGRALNCGTSLSLACCT